jgi:virginiamycin B lyase
MNASWVDWSAGKCRIGSSVAAVGHPFEREQVLKNTQRSWRWITTVAGVLALTGFGAAAAQAGMLPALSGQISSAEEGVMEGVVVSARKDGSTITVSVVSDDKGHFAFPSTKLVPGHYMLTVRAVGYDLDGVPAAQVVAGHAATVDLALKKTKDLSAQLTNAEWLLSMPGTEQQKKFLLNCTGCHTLERIVKSTHDAAEFAEVIHRMSGYYPGSMPTHPQRLHGDFTRDRTHGDDIQKTTAWLASINLNGRSAWAWPLQTLPRLTGKSTHVVITEYDLPDPLAQPHDVVLDHEGNVWFSDFGQMFLGKLDPATGKVTRYPVPENKKGFPVGSLDLEVDSHDNLWVGMQYQAEVARFDQKTGQFRTWPIPKEWDSDGAQFGHLAVAGTDADGKVWIKNSDGTEIYRLDLASDKMEDLGAPKDPATGKKLGTYGLFSDAQNDVYLLNFSGGNIGRIDAKTKMLTLYPTPTPNSHPRRGRVDPQGRLWFGEYLGNAIGMLDPKTGNIKEWTVPTPWSSSYDAAADRYGDAWTGSMSTDRVSRLDIASGRYTEYQLPRPTNIRRVFIDDRKNPATLWVGNNHGASIVKVEPLD